MVDDGATIIALATPPGRGALAILRVSGPEAHAFALHLAPGIRRLAPRVATRARIVDREGMPLDDALLLFFAAPASATGEDILEIHIHGSPLIAEGVLERATQAGLRLAGPGEFTRRAFLNGKVDLSAAEAVADVIAAEHRSALRAATARLGGALHDIITEAQLDLRSVLEELAAALDFPDEVAEPERTTTLRRIKSVHERLAALLTMSHQGGLVHEGAHVVIVGPPNAGKSSLLNALLKTDRALVSATPGTTRDTIEERLDLDGLLIRLTDTAGLRETEEAIEAEGIARAHRLLATSRLALVVIDGSQPLGEPERRILRETRDRERLLFFNKADLGESGYTARDAAEGDALHGSTHDPVTIQRLTSRLRSTLVGNATSSDLERPSLTRARERDAAQTALSSLTEALITIRSGEPLDLLTGDLTSAIATLGHITGATASEEMLDGIFARFCIGK